MQTSEIRNFLYKSY